MTIARKDIAKIKFVANIERPKDNPTRLNFAIEISGLRLLAHAVRVAQPYLTPEDFPEKKAPQGERFKISGDQIIGYTVTADDQHYECNWAFIHLISRLRPLNYERIEIDADSLDQVAAIGQDFVKKTEGKKGAKNWFGLAAKNTPTLEGWQDLIKDINEIQRGQDPIVKVISTKAKPVETKVVPLEVSTKSIPVAVKNPINGYLIAGIALFALFAGIAIAVFASGGLAAAATALALAVPFLGKAGAITAISITGLGALGSSTWSLYKSKRVQHPTDQKTTPSTTTSPVTLRRPSPPAAVTPGSQQSNIASHAPTSQKHYRK